MSTVPQYNVVLPSPAMMTLATEVVGEITALMATAKPRPRRKRAGAAVERLGPVQPLGHAVERALVLGVLQDLAGGVRPAFAQDVLAAEFERIDLERARDHVGVALIGPHQLGNAEAAQRPRRRHIGVERVGIDPDIVDVVGAGGGEARLLRHARTDIGVGAAVPVHLAFARRDAAGLVDAGLDAERAGVLGDGVELLLHGERNLDRPPHDHGERGHQRFELDVELAAEAAAEIGHLDADAVLGPAEQPGDLGAHEGRTLRGAVDRHARFLSSLRSTRMARARDGGPSACGRYARRPGRPRQRPCRRRRA